MFPEGAIQSKRGGDHRYRYDPRPKKAIFVYSEPSGLMVYETPVKWVAFHFPPVS